MILFTGALALSGCNKKAEEECSINSRYTSTLNEGIVSVIHQETEGGCVDYILDRPDSGELLIISDEECDGVFDLVIDKYNVCFNDEASPYKRKTSGTPWVEVDVSVKIGDKELEFPNSISESQTYATNCSATFLDLDYVKKRLSEIHESSTYEIFVGHSRNNLKKCLK